jgi:hypothetical protein
MKQNCHDLICEVSQHLSGLKKATRNLSQDGLSLGQILKLQLPENEA